MGCGWGLNHNPNYGLGFGGSEAQRRETEHDDAMRMD